MPCRYFAGISQPMITLYPVPTCINAYSIISAHEDGFNFARMAVETLIRFKGYPRFSMPCGTSVCLRDIPKDDVPCPCGDPTHYLVKYYLAPSREVGIKN